MNSLEKLWIFSIISFYLFSFVDSYCKAKEPCKWVNEQCYTKVKNTIARCTPGRICHQYQYLRRANVCPPGFTIHTTVRCTGEGQNTENYRHFCCKADKNYTVTGLPYMTPLDYENSNDVINFPDIVEDGIPLPHEPIPHPGEEEKSAFVYAKAWPMAQIPYYVNYSLAGWTSQQRTEITKAMNNYEINTCVRFYAKTSQDKNWVSIENNPITNTKTNCGLSQVCGPVGGRQYCSVGPPCANAEWLVHELGHSLCFAHEHQREDRVKYIYFNSRVCTADSYPKRLAPSWTTQNLPFDFKSIMMYNGCKPNSCFQRQPGQGSGPCGEPADGTGRLSPTDIIRVNLYHKCDCSRYKCK